MPLIHSDYRSPWPFRNGHLQTLSLRLFRHRPSQRPEPDYFKTDDGDELELFWYRPEQSDTLVIFSHGLESHAKDGPLLSFAHTVSDWGYHTLNWSMRSCGKRLNRTRWFYLGHDYQDLKALVNHYSQHYRRIYLVSVSLGGTITANYLGKGSSEVNPVVKGAFLLSPPLELDSFHAAMTRPLNHWLYQRHFVRSLLDKFERKSVYIDFGEEVDMDSVRSSKSVDHIEDRLFAPMHGFESSRGYRQHASSLPHLKNITVPTYILTAEDDPFIDNNQLPVELARESPNFYLEIAPHGGHTGFVKRQSDSYHWYEHRFRWFMEKSTVA